MDDTREHPELSVVLPSYSEGANLAVLLPRLNRVLSGMDLSYEIIVVDTPEPRDNTSGVCAEHDARYLNRLGNDSYGAAVRTGIDAVRGQYALFMDADGSHPPEFLPQLYKHREQYRIVIASRYVEGGSTDNPALLVGMSRMVNAVFSLTLGWNIKDVSNSLKLYRSADLKSLHLVSRNLDIIEEVLFKIIKANKNCAIKEVPFSFEKRQHGDSKRSLVKFILSYLTTLVKLRLGMIR